MSTTKTSVSTVALHLTNVSTDQMGAAILTAILKRDSITQTILEAMLKGMASKIPIFQRYARDQYTLGLPSGVTAPVGIVTNAALEPIIKDDISYEFNILVHNNTYTTLTPKWSIIEYLRDSRGYNYNTDVVSIPPPGAVWDINNPPATDTSCRLESVFLNSNLVDADITYNLLNYIAEYTDDDLVTHPAEWKDAGIYEETVPIPGVAGIVWDEDCVYALYQKLDVDENIIAGYYDWLYVLSDGTYPSLNIVPTPVFDEFLPVVPLRYANVDLTGASRKELDLFKTSDKLLSKVGVGFEELGDRLNENPDVGEMDNAYVMFGVDLQSNHMGSILYLSNFFNHLYLLANSNYYATAEAGETSFLEYGLNLAVKHTSITRTVVPGSIGNGRDGQSTKNIESYLTPYEEPVDDSGTTRTVYLTEYKLVLETQLNKSSVRRLEIYGLEVVNKIYQNYAVTTSLEDVALSVDEHNLIIPIQYDIAHNMSMLYRNPLYSDSALMVINSYQVVKLKWYETGWFRFIVIVVVIIIMVWFQQWYLGKLLALLVAGEYVAAVLMVLVSVLVGIVVDYAMDWIIEKYGTKFGIIATLVLVIVAIILSRGQSGFQLFNMMLSYSQIMLQAAMALISSTNEFLIEAGDKIINEYAIFADKLSDRWEELQTATDLLDWKADIDPLTFTRPSRYKIIPSETPTAFFNRCFELARNSTYGIHDEIGSFVDTKVILQRSVTADLYNMNSQ